MSGTAAKENPFRISTKRANDTSDLVLYEYRVYSPSTGRWQTRDAIGESGGPLLYGFLGNSPVGVWDVLGLWWPNVHYDATKRWAKALGYPEVAADLTALADDNVDSGPTNPISGSQEYHFNRNLTGILGDTRLLLHASHYRIAKRLCSKSVDLPVSAAEQLGIALHPLQDWVAHGDFGLRMTPRIWVVHNAPSPQSTFGDNKGDYPDLTWLDAVGSSDGRPAGTAMRYLGNSVFDYAIFAPGIRRWTLTKSKSETVLRTFRDYVRSEGGCNCQIVFGLR